MGGDGMSDKQVCQICDTGLRMSWTDYHGEAVCQMCGTPYQVFQYDENNNRIDAPPAINIKDDYVPKLREYWQKFRRNMGLGTYLGAKPRQDDFNAFHEWLSV
jgi:hypothetical protein